MVRKRGGGEWPGPTTSLSCRSSNGVQVWGLPVPSTAADTRDRKKMLKSFCGCDESYREQGAGRTRLAWPGKASLRWPYPHSTPN